MKTEDAQRAIKLLQLAESLIDVHGNDKRYEEILPDVVTSILSLAVRHIETTERSLGATTANTSEPYK